MEIFKSKYLGYAYPTSPLADKHNKGKGFWYVQVADVLTKFDDDDFGKVCAWKEFRALDFPIAPFSFTNHNTPFLNWE